MAEVVYKNVRTENDIQDLYKITGAFHDSCIDFCECRDDTLCLKLDIWGCCVELIFVGSVACSMNLNFLVERGDPEWWKGTILMENGYVYLADQPCRTVDDVKSVSCWFCGRNLRYRVMPYE